MGASGKVSKNGETPWGWGKEGREGNGGKPLGKQRLPGKKERRAWLGEGGARELVLEAGGGGGGRGHLGKVDPRRHSQALASRLTSEVEGCRVGVGMAHGTVDVDRRS